MRMDDLKRAEPIFEGRTFDDFLFRPARGVVRTRRDVTLTSPLTPGIDLELPVVSANMDSVTDGEMAKAMALQGGLGFIHRGMSIDQQVREVAGVKRSHGFVVDEPFRIPRGMTLREARRAMAGTGTSLLVVEEEGSDVLAGLLSSRDLPWFGGREDEPVDRFMTPFDDLQTGSPDIGIEEAERALFQNRVEKLPLVDGERRIRGLITKKDVILHRHRPDVTKDARGRLVVGAAIGATGDYLERAEALVEAGLDVVLMDVAHGHSDVMGGAVEAFRKRFPDVPLVAGNVGTGEGAFFLAERGVDAVKVGIGPGRGCRTRLETAAGVPQLQAIREVWVALHGSDAPPLPIIADGGVKDDKDLFLALACGASTVMMGSALSGTDESPGRVIEDPSTGRKLKIYRGMTSPQAVLEGLYRAEGEEGAEEALATPPEGQEIQVPYKGSVVEILERMRGHLRSAVSYAGTASLDEARKGITSDPSRWLIPLSDASRRESYER